MSWRQQHWWWLVPLGTPYTCTKGDGETELVLTEHAQHSIAQDGMAQHGRARLGKPHHRSRDGTGAALLTPVSEMLHHLLVTSGQPINSRRGSDSM